MNHFYTQFKNRISEKNGFVLPFTLFICGIMILISLSISTLLTKQIYFSQLARDSQAAYYAADNAVACTLSVDETYTDEMGAGIFPSNAASTSNELRTNMDTILASSTERRSMLSQSVLAPSLNVIQCGQSSMFVTTGGTDFKIVSPGFTRTIVPINVTDPTTEDGVTSTFNMKMDVGDGTFRCAKVTVNKTPSYRQIIAQGYSRCNKSSGTVERAVIDTTIIK